MTKEYPGRPRASGIGNSNFPKCKSCTLNGCNAGEINHDTRRTSYRGLCVFECGCTRFIELDSNGITLEDQNIGE